MAVVEINYTAYPKQNIFHGSDADETVYGGAKGGGKSAALVMDAVAYALKFKRAKIYLFRRTFDELEANLIDELFKRVPEKTKEFPNGIYIYDKQRHIATFGNGSKIFFRYVRNLQDAKKYAGREMDYCGIDELTQHEEAAIEILRSCIRSPLGHPARFKATCNPGDIGHIWVKKRYITPTGYGSHPYYDNQSCNKILFIPAKVYDNAAIMDNDPNYVKRLENLPPSLREAFLNGNWDIFEDAAFPEWDYSVHVCRPFPIPDHWKKWRAVDNGYTDPYAWYWLAVDEDGRVYFYREMTRDYGDNKIGYSDQARKAVELETTSKIIDGELVTVREKCDFTVVGHDAFNAHPLSEGKAIIDYYRDGGINDCIRCVPDRKLRKATWHEYLKPEKDENTEKLKARVMIFDTCTHLIDTLPQQVTDPNDAEKVAETDYDHWYDAAGYGIIAHHIKKSRPKPEDKSPLMKQKAKIARRNKLKNSPLGYM